MSSPPAVGGVLYLGTDTTNAVALRASDGKVLWRFNAPGAIKAGPSYHDGRVYAGRDDGTIFAYAKSGGPVQGTATVIGHTVSTTSLKTRETTGIDGRTTSGPSTCARPAARRWSPTDAAST